MPHETTAHSSGVSKAHEPQKAEQPKAAEAASHDPKVLMEGTGGIKVVRFTIDGHVKSLNLPVSGADLYRIAGSPAKLSVGGKAIANDNEPIDLADDAELKASY